MKKGIGLIDVKQDNKIPIKSKIECNSMLDVNPSSVVPDHSTCYAWYFTGDKDTHTILFRLVVCIQEKYTANLLVDYYKDGQHVTFDHIYDLIGLPSRMKFNHTPYIIGNTTCDNRVVHKMIEDFTSNYFICQLAPTIDEKDKMWCDLPFFIQED
jgi:hypothetical protein